MTRGSASAMSRQFVACRCLGAARTSNTVAMFGSSRATATLAPARSGQRRRGSRRPRSSRTRWPRPRPRVPGLPRPSAVAAGSPAAQHLTDYLERLHHVDVGLDQRVLAKPGLGEIGRTPQPFHLRDRCARPLGQFLEGDPITGGEDVRSPATQDSLPSRSASTSSLSVTPCSRLKRSTASRAAVPSASGFIRPGSPKLVNDRRSAVVLHQSPSPSHPATSSRPEGQRD